MPLDKQMKEVIFPPATGVGIGVTGDKSQDSKSLEVVCKRCRSAACELMDMDFLFSHLNPQFQLGPNRVLVLTRRHGYHH